MWSVCVSGESGERERERDLKSQNVKCEKNIKLFKIKKIYY